MSEAGKRLVVLGAAESGVGAALLGKQKGWDVFVSDFGAIKETYKQELEAAAIAYEENGHTEARILKADCVVKSPGISEKVAIIQKVRAAGIYVCGEIEFGYKYVGNGKIIAITGSNGKSTTTKLIYHTLITAGYDAALVGNIGVSFAGQIASQQHEWYVMEISSFQLDDIDTFKPHIAVLLNITPDHLDRYNYQFENYVASKFRITKNQDAGDFLILNMDDSATQQYLTNHIIHATKLFFTMNGVNPFYDNGGGYAGDGKLNISYGGERLNMSIHDMKVKGRHNQYNSMAAGIGAMVAGIRKERIRESFETFEGLEHRLEYVATIKGVDFINDSKATNVNSVWFALESANKPTILILGGQDKGNDYSEITELVKEKVKAIVCLGVDNTAIHQAFDGVAPVVVDTSSAKEAVKTAFSLATKGDMVLLAPACASFDLFKNYEDRGRQFKDAVREL
jgi:UDP-N-acetylmuramoylalanine--D-glutamate ligase